MKLSGRPTIILSLVGLFLIGVATGVISTVGLRQARLEKDLKMVKLEDSIMDWAKSRLELTPDQAVRIKPLVGLACDEYRAEQLMTLQRVIEIIRNSNRRISVELTPQQVDRLRKLETEHEESLHRKFNVELPPRR